MVPPWDPAGGEAELRSAEASRRLGALDLCFGCSARQPLRGEQARDGENKRKPGKLSGFLDWLVD